MIVTWKSNLYLVASIAIGIVAGNLCTTMLPERTNKVSIESITPIVHTKNLPFPQAKTKTVVVKSGLTGLGDD